MPTPATVSRAAADVLPPSRKAEVLIEALPWLERFADSIVLVKIGGHAMVDRKLLNAFARDVAFLHRVGIKPVIVHGGGPQINHMLDRLGVHCEFHQGRRVTTPDVMSVVRMVLTGSVQRQIVAELNRDVAHAVGISGEDGGLFTAVRRTAAGSPGDLGLVGDVVSVQPKPIWDLLESRRIPVVSTIAPDSEDSTQSLNINADDAAAELALALGATKLVIVTDVDGLHSTWPSTEPAIPRIGVTRLESILPTLEEGMRPKMEACLRAVRGGIPRAHVIDGRIPHSMLLEVFTNEDMGTMVLPDDSGALERHDAP